MKNAAHIAIVLIVLAMVAILFHPAWGRTIMLPPGESDDKTLSPYFFVKSDDPAVDRLPLKATSAEVAIAGVIADVRVRQVYKNEGKTPLEAVYIFPASTRAAVYGMKMTVGKRTIEAKINKREEARREYEEALRQGRSASLLEQQRPNVFQMNVGNIMPRDEITVELSYTELLVPTEKVYEFVYPAVVGPRYSNQSAETAPASERWVQNPYLRQGEAPTYAFDIHVSIAAGMPVKDIGCSSHKIKTTFDGPDTAKIGLDPAEKHSGNRDYVLRYRLDGDRIQSGLLLHEGEKENFFLLTVQPPKRIAQKQIPGREYIFIVDVSGSMHGFPLDISKKLLADLIGGLRPTDLFNVLLFSGGSSVMAAQSLPAGAENIRRAIALIESRRAGGGTELLPAFRRALNLKKSENYSRSIVIVTDGYVSVEEEVFDLIRNNLDRTNVFAFGIGASVNRHLIEGMARVGMGEPFIVTRPDEAPAKAERFRKMIRTPVLAGIDLRIEGLKAYDVEPVKVPDVLADRPVIVFGKYKGKAQGKMILSGASGGGPFNRTIEIGAVQPRRENAALRYLWARHRIALLSDYEKLHSDAKRIKEATELGLAYNLLTAYTSFVAVDSEVRNQGGETTKVKQPLPLPEGVSDYAVGGPGPAINAMRTKMSYDMALRYPSSPAAQMEERADGPSKKGWTVSRIEIRKIQVSSGLTESAVEKVIQDELGALENCAAAIGKAELIVKLSISADGAVKSVEISGAGVDSGVKKCLAGHIRKWRFEKTLDGKEVKAVMMLRMNG